MSGCGCGSGGVSVASYPGSGPGVITPGVTGCASTAAVGMERTRYFPRQLVGADDLTQDQLYLREKSRRHNRMMHGWGIVCGARVRKGDGDCEVVVEPGYILGPYGDEIQIDMETVVDVCSEDLNGSVASGCEPKDPWCTNVRVERPADRPLYLAVSYAECLSRPVRAVADGCGCDDSACEYSRIRDSFRIVVLDELPSTYPPDASPPDFWWTIFCRPPDNGQEGCNCPVCPDCPLEPWVILADLTVEGGEVTEIDCDSHRRYVVSFGSYYYVCQSAGTPEKVRAVMAALARSIKRDALDKFAAENPFIAPPVRSWTGDRLLVVGVAANSVLGQKLKKLTIGEIAVQGQEAFVKEMVDAVTPAQKKRVATLAADAWSKAADAVVTMSSAGYV